MKESFFESYFQTENPEEIAKGKAGLAGFFA